MLKSNNLMKKALNSIQLNNFIWFLISNVSDIKNFFSNSFGFSWMKKIIIYFLIDIFFIYYFGKV